MRAFRLARVFCAQQKVNYYKVLGVANSATGNEIKSKYKELVKKYHPDVYKGSDKDVYNRIHEAYKTLISPKKRMEYDESLGSQAGASGQPRTGKTDWSDIESEYKENASARDFYQDFNKVNTKRDADVKAEYEKFFKKPIKTDFEKVNVREDVSLSGFNDKDRSRAEFVDKFNEKSAVQTYINEQGAGFDKTVEETIEILNNNTTEKRHLRLLAMMESKGLTHGTMRVLGLGLGFFFMLVGVLAWTNKEREELMEQLLKKQDQEMEAHRRAAQLKDKMVFE